MKCPAYCTLRKGGFSLEQKVKVVIFNEISKADLGKYPKMIVTPIQDLDNNPRIFKQLLESESEVLVCFYDIGIKPYKCPSECGDLLIHSQGKSERTQQEIC